MIPPWYPDGEDNFDHNYVTRMNWKDKDLEALKKNAILLRDKEYQQVFSGYEYFGKFQKKGVIVDLEARRQNKLYMETKVSQRQQIQY